MTREQILAKILTQYWFQLLLSLLGLGIFVLGLVSRNASPPEQRAQPKSKSDKDDNKKSAEPKSIKIWELEIPIPLLSPKKRDALTIGGGALMLIGLLWIGVLINNESTPTPTTVPATTPPDSLSAYEENDTQDQAHGPLRFGYVYDAPPDDSDDWYYFVLDQESSVSVKVTNYSAVGQLIIYKDSPGSDPPRRILASDGRGQPTMEVPNELAPNALVGLPSGRYYVRIYSSGNINSDQNYHLIVTYE